MLLITNIALGKTFKKIESCGKAQVVEGKTCANAKVSFDFTGCKLSLPEKQIKNIKCDGQNIIARFEKSNFRYEAYLTYSNNDWSGEVFKSDGKLNQFQEEVATAATSNPNPSPIMLTPVTAPTLPAIIPPPSKVEAAPAAILEDKKEPLVTNISEKMLKEIGTCGSAGVIEGTLCSNAKVNFKFDRCKNNNNQVTPAKTIECAGEDILAKYQEGDYTYEAHFKKSTNEWGAIIWNLDGLVKEFQLEQILPPKKEVSTQIVPEAASFKFNGFADIRYTNFHVNHDPLITSGQPESGFGIEDGAFYTNYEKGKLAVILDVAFRRSKDSDLNSQAANPNQSSNNNLSIGTDKSQLYFKYKITPDMIFDFGQFDTIYGVEVNDSKDRVFGKTGLIYDQMLPLTHTGFMLEFNFLGNYYLKSFLADPNNKGSFGSSTTRDDTAELGGAIGFSNDLYHYQLGYMSRKIMSASKLNTKNRSRLDIFLGGTYKKLSLDLEYTRLDDPSKNTLTPSNLNDLENAGTGYFSLLSYKVNDEILASFRYENLLNDPSQQSIKSVSASGFSFHYKISAELEIRTEYIVYNYKGINSSSWDDSRFNIGSILAF